MVMAALLDFTCHSYSDAKWREKKKREGGVFSLSFLGG